MKKVYTLFVCLFSMTLAFGQLEGVWELAPTGTSLAVGPGLNDFSWWSIGDNPAAARPCIYDDQFVFNADGTFENVQDGSTWLEAWQGVSEDQCGAPVAPHDGSNAATWVDNGDGTFTLTGTGAHVGLAKVHNGGELANPADAPSSVTYEYAINGDNLTVDINFGAGYWHYEFVRGVSSVDEVVADQFRLYPNPATSQVQISSDEQLDQITIRDITGKVVLVEMNPDMNHTLDVSNLASGMYIVESRIDNLISVEKLAIQ
ncbi:MAG: T9SS type A sorting domain-containing protein [Bacteroidota bacterium]